MQTKQPNIPLQPTQFVLFGALGDLAWRLVVPAFFNLHLDGRLPNEFRLIGVDRELSTGGLAERLRDGIRCFSRRGAPTDEQWSGFVARLAAFPVDLQDPSAYGSLAAFLSVSEGDGVTRVYYLAIPPKLFDAVARGLAGAGMQRDEAHTCIAVEKPLGRDLEDNPAPDFPNYPAGSWGPEAAERLVAKDGRAWLTPSQWHPQGDHASPAADGR